MPHPGGAPARLARVDPEPREHRVGVGVREEAESDGGDEELAAGGRRAPGAVERVEDRVEQSCTALECGVGRGRCAVLR